MNLNIKLELKKTDFRLQADINIKWPLPCTHVIFGESGVGKTHLLRSICGLENPQGSITWQHNGDTIHWLDSAAKIHTPCQDRHVAMVFQDNQLFSHLNVEQNLRFAFDRSHATKQDWQHCVQALNITDLLQHTVQQLSGGQTQRVALARAILSKPRLLILDEPLASLDWQGKQDVMSYIKRLNHEWQLPILYVTHDINEVLTLCDHIVMLEKHNNVTLAQQPQALIDVLQDEQHAFHSLGKSSILIAQNEDKQKDGLAHYQVSGQTLRLPVTPDSEHHSQQLRLCISASDISLTLSPASDSSIVNILQGQVSRIEKTKKGQFLIQLKIGEQYLLSEISAYSFERLNIALSQTIYAQIKGIALQQNA